MLKWLMIKLLALISFVSKEYGCLQTVSIGMFKKHESRQIISPAFQ